MLDLWACGFDTADIASLTALNEADIAGIIHADQDRRACLEA